MLPVESVVLEAASDAQPFLDLTVDQGWGFDAEATFEDAAIVGLPIFQSPQTVF